VSVSPSVQILTRSLAASARASLLLLLLLVQAWQPVRAQSLPVAPFDGIDVEPPFIEHEVVPEADAGFSQLFRALVSDDQELGSVTLHWRFAGEEGYTDTPMLPSPDGATWSARVPTSDLESRAIEYYLQARDAGGNRTVRGFAFSPLTRRIRSSAPLAEPIGNLSPTVQRSTFVYYVLGALVVGLVAGLASSGGGGGGGGGPSECGSDGCEVVVTFQSPVVP